MTTEAIAELTKRIRQLEDENAELRDDNQALQETVDDLLNRGEPVEGFDDWE